MLDQLRAIIADKGLSTRSLARTAGVSRCGLGRILRGAQDPQLKTLTRVLAAARAMGPAKDASG